MQKSTAPIEIDTLNMKIFGVSVKKIPFYDDAHDKMLLLNSRNWKEIFRTISVFLVLLFCILVDSTAQYFLDRFFVTNVVDSTKFANTPAFDIIIWLLPDHFRIRKFICDILIFALVVIVFVVTVLYNSRQKIPFQGLTVLRRFFFIQSIAYFFHIFTVPFTLIPSINSDCTLKDQSETYSNALIYFLKLSVGMTVPCIDNTFSITVTFTSNLALFLLAYSWNWIIKFYGLIHAAITIFLLSLCHYHYSVSISLGIMASVFSFGTYHLLLLVFCQSKIFLGVSDSASMGFDLFFLNGFFCKNATRCIEWVDGLDLRQLQPFVAEFDKEDPNKSLLSSAKELIP